MPQETKNLPLIPAGRDDASGAEVFQVTRGPAIHHNIYFEVPYTDPSSRWAFFHEYLGDPLATGHEFGSANVWRADLQTGEHVLVCADVLCLHGAAISPDLRFFFACRRRRGRHNPRGRRRPLQPAPPA